MRTRSGPADVFSLIGDAGCEWPIWWTSLAQSSGARREAQVWPQRDVARLYRQLAKAVGYQSERDRPFDRLAPQAPNHFGDVILLKEADRGNAGRARVHAGASVRECDAAQGEDGDLLSASLT